MPFLAALLVVVLAGYTLLVRVLAAQQGAEPSWPEAVLWVLAALTTGATEISWQSEVGVLFETVVRLTGVVLLILLIRAIVTRPTPGIQPTTLLDDSTAPSSIDESSVVFLGDTALARAISSDHVEGASAVLPLEDTDQALALASTLAGADVVLTGDDLDNFGIAHALGGTVKSIAATATGTHAGALLQDVGVERVCLLDELLAQSLGRRIIGRDSLISVVWQDGELLLAEANTATTPLGGRPLKDWHETLAPISVLGSWEGSRYESATPETVVAHDGVLLLAGTGAQLVRMEAVFGVGDSDGRVVLVARPTIADPLRNLLSVRNIETTTIPIGDGPISEHQLLESGVTADEDTPTTTIVLASDDDSLTLFNTMLCRRLDPRARILAACDSSSAARELSDAGATFTVNRAGLAAQHLLASDSDDVERVAEGLFLYSLDVPESFRGRTLAESSIRVATGATVVAVEERGEKAVNPAPETLLGSECRLHLVGDGESRQSFLAQFG